MEDKILTLARKEALELHNRINKGEKAGLQICYPYAEGEDFCVGLKIGECFECGGKILFDDKVSHILKHDAKRICFLCAKRNHQDEIHPEVDELLKGLFN